MSRFNLIDEKWIPVRFPDGTRDELGIRDTLLRAKEIAAIEDPSPLVVASLNRFCWRFCIALWKARPISTRPKHYSKRDCQATRSRII